MVMTTNQRLALAIIDFLNTSSKDGTVAAEEQDDIEIASEMISRAFNVDPKDEAAMRSAVGSQNLSQIYGVYEKLKTTTAAAAASSSSATPDAQSSAKLPTDDEKARAEDLKTQGNKAMTAKDYPKAIDFYGQALALNPGNAIFLSNRAAAYSAARDHESARADAEAAVAADPSYTKAWSRLGLARYALGDPHGSMDAYKQGIEHEGNGGSDAMKKGYDTAKRRVDELDQEDRDSASPAPRGAPSPAPGAGGMPDLGSLAGMFGGGGGGGGGGGMPDLSSIMSNPMFASMAQNIMSNPGMLENLMSNPRMREMANQFGQGGGMPDMSALMNDPNIADMARNFMGGGGGGAGPGAASGSGRGTPGANPGPQ